MKAVPSCTYRLQLNPYFTFYDAAQTAGYLAELGISHVYLSPVLQAALGSTHGYDVVDPGKVNDELGGKRGFDLLTETLKNKGLGVVLDIVPNHMAISGPQNRWWQDVLENGPSSAFAAFFDVEWESPEAYLKNRILLPVLEDQYGRVLGAGLISVVRKESRFFVSYREHLFPVAPRSMMNVLQKAGWRCSSERLQFFGESLGNLPLPTATDLENTRIRHRNKEVIFALIDRHFRENPEEASVVDECLEELNADTEGLDDFLERQNYRLAWWRKNREDLGYRRFFDIDNLVALRVEDDAVFAETHRLLLKWVASGVVEGLRVDHIDGLKDPAAYLKRLRSAAPEAWILVEKILSPGKRLREAWPVEGTTGYDFLNLVNGLFIDPAGEEAMTRFYAEFTGEVKHCEELKFEKKMKVAEDLFGSDFNRLTHLAMEICENHPEFRDSARSDVMKVIKTLAVSFDVYRTYFTPWRDEQRDTEDEKIMEEALYKTHERLPEVDPLLIDLFGGFFTKKPPSAEEAEFVARFQQLTGPLAAKGIEDTLLYCYNRFIALNEVGGEPCDFSVTPERAHSYFREKAEKFPLTMNTLSTHDTKRSGDVRARLAILSEIPLEWAEKVKRWSRMNENKKTRGMPDANTEYFLYQTIMGAWPIDRVRLSEVMRKSVREAKSHTSWTNVNEPYERALMNFIDSIFEDDEFIQDLNMFLRPLIRPGRVASLAQALVMLTAPGVPDIYQGTETWDLSLVDPDNRRPVDFAMKIENLEKVKVSSLVKSSEDWDDGLTKQWMIWKVLNFKKNRPGLFGPGSSYDPVETGGNGVKEIFAFCRGGGVVTLVPACFVSRKAEMEKAKIRLSEGTWENIFDNQRYSGNSWAGADDLLKNFPVALLVKENRGKTP